MLPCWGLCKHGPGDPAKHTARQTMDVQQPTSPSESEPGTPEKSSGLKLRGGLVFPALIIVLLLAGGSLAYYAWLELNERLAQATTERQSLADDIATIDESTEFLGFKEELQQQITALEQQVTGLSKQVKEQANQQENTRSLVQQSLASVNRSQLQWGLNETLYILHLASHRLLIERDISGTIAALGIASTRLHELNDSRLLPVRESISRQIQKLKTIPDPDWVGISLQLNNLLDRIRRDSVNAKPTPNQRSEPRQPDPQESEPNLWQKLTGQVRDVIDDSITITRKASPSNLPTKHRGGTQTHEFLQTRLLSAKYALASRNSQGYHHELESALTWLETSAPLKNISGLADELGNLNSVNLEPELPDISEPSTLLADLLENIESR